MADTEDITQLSKGITDSNRGQIVKEDNGELTAPENIIKTPRAARSIYVKARQEHLKRIGLYAAIEGMFAGNPPYNPAELKRQKLDHIANFNTLDGRSWWEKVCLGYWNLLNEAEVIAKVTIEAEDPMARSWENTISYELNRVLRKWKSFTTSMNVLSGQLVKFGVSPVIWSDERDWRFRVVDMSKFYVPDQAQTDIEQLTYVAVETTLTAQFLWGVYNQYKDVKKEDTPWDIEELKNLLLRLANCPAKTDGRPLDFMELQRRLQNGDMHYDAVYSDSIKIITLLYQEYDGKWSHYMFHPEFDNGEFLFFIDRQYKSLYDAMVIFTMSPGEATIHSNRGLGHKIFAACQAMMQLDCSIVDMAKWASTILLSSVATGSRDAEQIRFVPGVPTHIGTAQFQQNNLGSNISQLVGASQYLNQKIQFNSANSGDDPGYPDSDKGSISSKQVMVKSFKEFGVLKNSIAHFYTQFDSVLETVFVKMLNSSKGDPGHEYVEEFKLRCISKGIPEEIFSISQKDIGLGGMPRHLSIRATRAAGDGSTLARIMGLEALAPIAGGFGPREANEYKRQWIMATQGPDQVSAFMQDSDKADEQAGGASLAGVENAIMQMGKAPIFSMDNEHRSHLVTHIALAMQIIQALQQQQMSPVDADPILVQVAQHLQPHFQAVAQSPFAQSFAKKVEPAIKQIIQVTEYNRKQAMAMMQAKLKQQQQDQQATQAVMSEEQRKDMQLINEERRKDTKVMSQVERADKANETRAEVTRHAADLKAENERYRIDLEHGNASKRINNEAAIQNKRVDQEGVLELRKQISDMAGNTPSPVDIE